MKWFACYSVCCLLLLSAFLAAAQSGPNPKPIPAVAKKVRAQTPGWYSGDIHVHRNCGTYSGIYSVDSLRTLMEVNDLSVISVLADMGNGEVQDAPVDLRRINEKDAPESRPGRIVHWDAEWHWDATYNSFTNQALGGHLVLLGLKEGKQLWEESPYRVLEWGKKQQAVRGFAHQQYLDGKIPDNLNCCIPVDLPVEAASGTLDFLSYDVFSVQMAGTGLYSASAAMEVYYKLLNCGIRLSLAAGTDYPCNDLEPLGAVMTYAKVKGRLTYRKWINAIRDGHTIISRTGNSEFLDLQVNAKYVPGDQLQLKENDAAQVVLRWTTIVPKNGTIELLQNGKVIATISGDATPGKPLVLQQNITAATSGWIAARRTEKGEFHSHTAPLYITVANKPITNNQEDATYFVQWINQLLKHTEAGGKWAHYFPTTLAEIRERYKKARSFYANLINP